LNGELTFPKSTSFGATRVGLSKEFSSLGSAEVNTVVLAFTPVFNAWHWNGILPDSGGAIDSEYQTEAYEDEPKAFQPRRSLGSK
jgi:hypothetical protein